MKKVVVTGGAGFIGSHLAEELTKSGYHVVIIDDLSTGKTDDIDSLLLKKNTDFIQGTINDLDLLLKVFENAVYVFHEAAIPSVPRSINNPLASHEANMTGTLNVLMAARNNKVKKVIYASSSSVYGDTPTLPKTEDMLPRPLSPYAVTKLAGEYYCKVFQEVYGLATICLRYFNVYGPHQDANSQYAAVIPTFIKNIGEGKAPVIFGDGNQTRDFTFVKDVVKANIITAEGDATGIFNIGGGKSVTLNDLTRIILKLTGSNLEPIYQPPRLGDIKHSMADIHRAAAIGYKPKYGLEDGLRETCRALYET